MDCVGSVLELLPERSVSTKSGVLQVYGFVIRTVGKYPKTICFSVLGNERWVRMCDLLSVGNEVSVLFEVSSRKWKDSWFTQCDAYSVRLVSGGSSGVSSSGSDVSSSNDVPF